MTQAAQAHRNLGKAIQLFDAGERPMAIVRKYCSIYANGTYGMNDGDLLRAARVCAECAPRSHRTV